MHSLLKDMATIRSGRLFRGKIEPDPHGHYQLIQIGDIDVDRKLSYKDLTRISLPDIKRDHRRVEQCYYHFTNLHPST